MHRSRIFWLGVFSMTLASAPRVLPEAMGQDESATELSQVKIMITASVRGEVAPCG